MILVGLTLLFLGLATDVGSVWALGVATSAVGVMVVVATARQLPQVPAVDRHHLRIVR